MRALTEFVLENRLRLELLAGDQFLVETGSSA
jgi:hypothetical protein